MLAVIVQVGLLLSVFSLYQYSSIVNTSCYAIRRLSLKEGRYCGGQSHLLLKSAVLCSIPYNYRRHHEHRPLFDENFINFLVFDS